MMLLLMHVDCANVLKNFKYNAQFLLIFALQNFA